MSLVYNKKNGVQSRISKGIYGHFTVDFWASRMHSGNNEFQIFFPLVVFLVSKVYFPIPKYC